MNHIKLPSPSLGKKVRDPHEFRYSISETQYLPHPNLDCNQRFLDVLLGRKTRREGIALDIADLSAFLWLTSKTRATQVEETGFLWQHRSSPSGGGRHPIDLILGNLPWDKTALFLYDPIAHSLGIVDQINEQARFDFFRAVGEVVDVGSGVIVWSVAQFDRTLSKYKNGESLVWLDAGALLATSNLVAETLSLSCCSIGITGEPMVSEMLGAGDLAEGVGGCLIWKRSI